MTDRKVFSPRGAVCSKCGEPLAFYQITEGKAAGKWCPCNPDGTDHWDLCREMQIAKGLREPGPMHYVGGRTVGANYQGEPYDGIEPPWE